MSNQFLDPNDVTTVGTTVVNNSQDMINQFQLYANRVAELASNGMRGQAGLAAAGKADELHATGVAQSERAIATGNNFSNYGNNMGESSQAAQSAFNAVSY